tara:strand:- start:273 stop:932 length:660 start_codon:yes stop_codon:yes gene_type:complete
MKFEGFRSQPPISPYAPFWDFRVGTSKCDDIDVNSLSQFLLSKEKEIKKLPSSRDTNGKKIDGYTGLGTNSITSKFAYYNLLTWSHPKIRKLKSNIVENLFKYNTECGNETPQELYVQCWYNVLRFGQKINPHMHSISPDCYLSGHFNVQVNDTSTCYMSPINQLNDPDVIDIKNKDGDMTLFPSYIFHYTTPHYSFKPRITIAFDLNLYKLHDNFISL